MSTQNRRILVAGASGFIGRALAEHLTRKGYHVSVLRRAPCGKRLEWNPERGALNPLDLEGFYAVIHLGGESIFGRWSNARRERIRLSRVQSTTLLARTLASLVYKPEVFICASAIGYYGPNPGQSCTEAAPAGGDFLARVCVEWEASTRPAQEAGIRTVQLRQGVVLSKSGGFLGEILPWFVRGWGAKIGDGTQQMAWVGIEDLCAMYACAIEDDALEGPINAVSSAPVSNEDFTRQLASALHTHARLRVPSSLVRLLLGAAGRCLLLANQTIIPEKLRARGFEYRTPTLESFFKEEFKDGPFFR